MTDTTSYDVQTDMRGQQDQTSMLIGLLVLGLVIGGAVAFFCRSGEPETAASNARWANRKRV